MAEHRWRRSGRGPTGKRREGPAGRGRAAVLLAAGMVCTALVATLAWTPRPLLVWNASASSPLGLYYVSRGGETVKGAMAIAWLPLAIRPLAGARRYLPVNIPIVKRVAAGPGDRVCAAGQRILINGRQAAVRLERDRSGRPLPRWEGCRRLEQGDVFLLSPAGPTSFDGRYWGISKSEHIIGEARRIWAA